MEGESIYWVARGMFGGLNLYDKPCEKTLIEIEEIRQSRRDSGEIVPDKEWVEFKDKESALAFVDQLKILKIPVNIIADIK